jgi:FAD/FMN-containing dehydrogenase
VDLAAQLKEFFTGEIDESPDTLTKYSKDASLFEIKPKVVVYPKTSKDIENLIDFVTKHHTSEHLSITPRSAGTDMSGGAINDSIIMDMTKYFNRVKEIGHDFAVTQPGVYYRDFEKETLKHNLLLPCYTASRDLNTVGGMAANNSAGEKTLQYGQTKDYVESLKVIFSDGKEYLVEPLDKGELDHKMSKKTFEGEVYRKVFDLVSKNNEVIKAARPQTHKNSSGYLLWDVWDGKTFDLTKAIVGSQGTLGVITEIKFRLVKPKKHSKLLVMFLKEKDLFELGHLVNIVLGKNPETFEALDDQTLKVAMKYINELFSVIKPENVLSMALDFIPEMTMVLTGGMPKLILIAQFTGDSEKDVLDQCEAAQEAIKPFGLKSRITQSAQESTKYMTMRRQSFNLLRKHAGNLRTAPFIDDFCVKPEYLPEFLPKLNAILGQYHLLYTMAGHVGDGNFHIIPLMDLKLEHNRKIIPELSEKVYELVLEYHGSITAEHNDGLVRGIYLKDMFGEEMVKIFKELKNIFDPDNIFNPHKKIDATTSYSWDHISKS